MEPQPGAPTPGNTGNYEFILSPDKQKKGGGIGFIKDPFIAKIVFLVGGAVLLMIVIGVVVNLAFSGKTSVETFVALAQREEEIIRISDLDKDAVDQQVKNAAINTRVSVKSHQNKSLAYLTAREREIKPEELSSKKDAATDDKLKRAKAASTFDAVYTEIMRSQLTTYADMLKNAYDNESDSVQQHILSRQYDDVAALLKMWPEE